MQRTGKGTACSLACFAQLPQPALLQDHLPSCSTTHSRLAPSTQPWIKEMPHRLASRLSHGGNPSIKVLSLKVTLFVGLRLTKTTNQHTRGFMALRSIVWVLIARQNIIPWWITCFSQSYDKIPGKGDLGTEGWLWLTVWRSVMAEEDEVPLHLVRKQRELNAQVLFI